MNLFAARVLTVARWGISQALVAGPSAALSCINAIPVLNEVNRALMRGIHDVGGLPSSASTRASNLLKCGFRGVFLGQMLQSLDVHVLALQLDLRWRPLVILLGISFRVLKRLSLEKHLVVGIAHALECGTRDSIF